MVARTEVRELEPKANEHRVKPQGSRSIALYLLSLASGLLFFWISQRVLGDVLGMEKDVKHLEGVSSARLHNKEISVIGEVAWSIMVVSSLALPALATTILTITLKKRSWLDDRKWILYENIWVLALLGMWLLNMCLLIVWLPILSQLIE